MKKYLLLASVAALAFTSCSDQSTEFVGDEAAQKAREISFAPIAKPTTRAIVDGTDFPTTLSMQVAAFDVTNKREFFPERTFAHSSSKTYPGESTAKNYWVSNPATYWPLSATYINFLAYTNFNGTTKTWNWGSDAPATNPTLALTMTDNSIAQADLMYAMGNGEVTYASNVLTFPANVPMVFNHAQAWISFNAKAKESAESNKVTLKSITLNGAKYNGIYTITYTAGRANTGQSVAGTWSSLGSTADVAVPNWTAAAIAYDGSGNGVPVGDGLMIVPDDTGSDDFTSFTIAYSLDGNDYTYTYAPASKNVVQGQHYIYNIVFDLHEIEITPSVTDWADQTGENVPIF